MVVRALAASIAVFGALASAVPVAQGTAREAFHQWGSQISPAPIPARWGQVQELEQVLAVQSETIGFRRVGPLVSPLTPKYSVLEKITLV